MNFEYGLYIIWEKARNFQEVILTDMKKRFEIDNIFEIEWDKDIFSCNLTRFYGENLPSKSNKEKHCGNGKFLLVIVKDHNPIYNYRRTTKGKEYVNINFFDSKSLYRHYSGTHRVHGSNNRKEFEHDLMMLLGVSIDDYEKKYSDNNNNIIKLKQNVIGTKPWKSLEEIFYVMNSTIEYVVLRNFQGLPKVYETGIHSDIDILCDKKDNLSKILNAITDKKSKKRSRYKVFVGDSFVYMDFRQIGDDYYCKNWECNILKNRIKEKCFYIPCDTDYIFSLLYHALVQKRKIAEDYKDKFEQFFPNNNLKTELDSYMSRNGYNYVDCSDYSVYFNSKITGKKMRFYKELYFICIRAFYKLKGWLKNDL